MLGVSEQKPIARRPAGPAQPMTGPVSVPTMDAGGAPVVGDSAQVPLVDVSKPVGGGGVQPPEGQLKPPTGTGIRPPVMATGVQQDSQLSSPPQWAGPDAATADAPNRQGSQLYSGNTEANPGAGAGGANPAEGMGGAPPPAGPSYGPGQFQGRVPQNDQEWGALGHGQAVEGLPGYSWYHTGSGWIQAPTGQDPRGGAAGGAATKPKDMRQLLSDKINQMLLGNPDDASLDSPALRKQVQANRLGQQRNQERMMADAAERGSAAGLTPGSGAAEALRNQIAQARGAQEGQFEAGLLGQEIAAQRDQLKSVMALSAGMLSDQDRNALQERIAQMDDATKRLGISEGGRQFDADLAERMRQFGIDDLFRNRSLSSSESQANAARSQADTRMAQAQAQWEAEQQWGQLMDLFGLMGV